MKFFCVLSSAKSLADSKINKRRRGWLTLLHGGIRGSTEFLRITGYWTEWTEKDEKHQMFISLQLSDSRRSGAP